MLVSLIVVTYNSMDLLPRFLEALAQTRYVLYELIVVDNASVDGTLDFIRAEAPMAQVVANNENIGFGRACNRGAALARGELLFMNPDVVVTPLWLDGLLASVRSCPKALLCPTTLYPGEVPPTTVGLHAVAAIPGAAMLVPRSVWNALGGFDEQFFLYWEDTELCWRAWLLGFGVFADLGTYVYHERGGSTGGGGWDAERTKNSLRTYLKLMRWRTVVPFTLLLLLKTAVKWARTRDSALLDAWWWNLRHLALTLAERRSLHSRRRGNPAGLEHLIALQEQQLRAARRGLADRVTE